MSAPAKLNEFYDGSMASHFIEFLGVSTPKSDLIMAEFYEFESNAESEQVPKYLPFAAILEWRLPAIFQEHRSHVAVQAMVKLLQLPAKCCLFWLERYRTGISQTDLSGTN